MYYCLQAIFMRKKQSWLENKNSSGTFLSLSDVFNQMCVGVAANAFRIAQRSILKLVLFTTTHHIFGHC